jgi:hypothetical protein
MFGQCVSRECEEFCNIAHDPIEWPCAEPGCAMEELVSSSIDSRGGGGLAAVLTGDST